MRRFACNLTIRTILLISFLFTSFNSFAIDSSAGATIGSFSVDRMGAALYSINLAVPPGTAGMTPSISLNYSSQGGVGLMGAGWSFGDLSSITRCGASLELDGYNQGVAFNDRDRFCMDGQRLIAINGVYGADGTEYRTQNDSYSKIISHGRAGSGPQWFEVRTKSGQIITYGLDNRSYCSTQGVIGDSRIEAQYRSDVLTWAIGKVEDRVGNYIQYCYMENNSAGEYRVEKILYTGNDSKSLSPYASVRFIYEDRIDKIVHYVKRTKVSINSRLKTIKTKVGSTDVLSYNLAYRESTNSAKTSLLTSVQECSADNNCKPSTRFTWQDAVNTKTFGPWQSWGVNINPVGARCAVGDINRDGRSDMICGNYRLLSTGSSFTVANIGYYGKFPILADINGDDYIDLLGMELDFDGELQGRYVRYGSASGFGNLQSLNASGNFNYIGYGAGDRNGDGHADVFALNAVKAAPWIHMGVVADLDGDGLADMTDVNYDGETVVYYSTVNGFTSNPSYWGIYTHLNIYSWGDVDGDGKLEFIAERGMLDQNGYLFNPSFTGGTPDYSADSDGVYLADVDGDGLSDIVRGYGSSVALAIPKNVDLLTKVTDGMGQNITINYSDAKDPSIYIQTYNENDLPFPVSPLRTKLSLVKSYSIDNGNGGQYAFSYQYIDGLVHRKTYGFLGFKQVKVIDNRSGIVKTATYSQDYAGHKLGLQLSEETKKQNGNYLSSKSFTWQALVYSTQYDNNKRIVIRMLSEIEKSYSVYDGSEVTNITTSYTYDDDGNILTSTVAGSGYTKTTTNVYSTDQGYKDIWCLGRLTNSTVTHAKNGFPTIIRTSSFDYYPDTCLLKYEQEGVTSGQWLKKVYEYDSYGNKNKVTISGSDITTRITTINYDAANGRFPINSTNALGQSESYIYDGRFGIRISLTGPNALTTTWGTDTLGRIIKETHADGTYVKIDYTNCETNCIYGSPFQITKQKFKGSTVYSAPSIIYYDSLGREIRLESYGYGGIKIIKETAYDDYGHVWKVSKPHFDGSPVYQTVYQYDDLDRVRVEENPDGSITRKLYDGLSTYIVNDKCQVRIEYKNVQGKIEQVSNAKLSTCSLSESDSTLISNIRTLTFIASTHYSYDAIGNMVSVIDAAGNTTTMTYDSRGNKQAMNDPDMGYWVYGYDALGQLVCQRDAKNYIAGDTNCKDDTNSGNPADPFTVKVTYDVLGRMISRVEREGASSWEYDNTAYGKAVGKITKAWGPANDSTEYYYDEYGRLKQTKLTYNGSVYTTSNTFDDFGRIDITTYPSGFKIQNVYESTYGYIKQIRNAVNTQISYWTLTDANAEGQVTEERLGNNITTAKQYDPMTSRLNGIARGGVDIRTYHYDSLGNLEYRVNVTENNKKESFDYDDLNRLRHTKINDVLESTINYDSIGNITYKAGVGNYEYDQNNPGVRPHAVTKAGSVTYGYDANGNMTSGDGRTISYTAFNKPNQISRGDTTNNYYYNVNRERLLKISSKNGQVTKTLYIGKGFEKITRPSGNVEYKHYFGAGSATVVHTIYSSTSSTIYLHKDHLGSTNMITDEQGNVVETLSFDAWGSRRNPNWTNTGNWGLNITSLTTRGFTGHEMDDGVGLINMNARMYDAKLGRFLQADVFIQFPYSTQGFNRYTYVNNNPLSYTDPSGHFLNGLFKSIRRFVKQYWRPILGIAVGGGIFNMLKLTYGKFIAGLVGGLAGGAVSTGSFDGAIRGGATGAMYGAIGESGLSGVGKITATGIVGGSTNARNPGGFRSGFLSAAFNEILSPINTEKNISSYPARVTLAAVIGGTASRIGGGKFANGAVTAAFAYMYADATTKTKKLKKLTLLDLRRGDILLTGKGGLAPLFSGLGKYGHAAIVLNVDGANVEVLSADETGTYQKTNLTYKYVGNRTWDVFRVSGIDTIKLNQFANSLVKGGGISQYAGNYGGNVCSSIVTRASEHAGGPSIPRLIGNLVTPNQIGKAYGPAIGNVYIPGKEGVQ